MSELAQWKKCSPEESIEFTKKEKERIAKLLRQPLKADLLKKRPAFKGKSVYYIDGGTSYNLANDIFGFDGWRSQIINTEIDFAKEKQKNSDRWFVGVTVIVRVELKNGAYHEDLGFGEAINVKGRGAAIQKAKKEAVTDATKRALRVFGNGLGNCLRLKWYLEALKKGKSFEDMQQGEYSHGDLIHPKTGGVTVSKPKPAPAPPQDEKNSTLVGLPVDVKLHVPEFIAKATSVGEKEFIHSSMKEPKGQSSVIFGKKPIPAKVDGGNGFKRHRKENQVPRKFRRKNSKQSN